jgi:hypothetical protein
LVDQSISDDGWFRGTVGEVMGMVVTGEGSGGGLVIGPFEPGSDEELATGLMSLNIGFDADGKPVRTVWMDSDLDWTANPTTNLTVPAGPTAPGNLDTRFDPSTQQSVMVSGLNVGLNGGGTVSLPTITGWNNPVEGSDIDAFPVSVGEWKQGAAGDVTVNYPSTVGTTNWADQNQRMWYISNMFQQGHTDPLFFDGLPQFGLDAAWGQQLAYLPPSTKR